LEVTGGLVAKSIIYYKTGYVYIDLTVNSCVSSYDDDSIATSDFTSASKINDDTIMVCSYRYAGLSCSTLHTNKYCHNYTTVKTARTDKDDGFENEFDERNIQFNTYAALSTEAGIPSFDNFKNLPYILKRYHENSFLLKFIINLHFFYF
jgi:hypothetical protein